VPPGDRILLVDDDTNIRKILSLILGDAGYVVDTAESGKEAIAKSDANSYNLAVVDVRLGDMECTKLLSRLYETRPRMMKIVLTGYPLSEDALRTLSQGVDGYLAKPVKSDQLLKTVNNLLERQTKETATVLPSNTLTDT